MIVKKKNNSIKFFLDARHLNSNTDQSSKSWPLGPLETQHGRASYEKSISAIVSMYPYAHTTLDDKTFKLTAFSSGDKVLLSLESFMSLKVFQTILLNKCLSFSKIWSTKDLNWFIMIILYLCHVPNHISCWISDNFMILLMHEIWSWFLKNRFSCFFLENNFGQKDGLNTIKPFQSKIAAIHKLTSQTTKIEPMRLIGSMNIYSTVFDKIHVKMKPP